MKQYHELLKTIKEKGTYKAPARENMPGTLSLFGYQNRYNLQDGFPMLTTKKVNFKHIVTELLWFLKGDTNIKYLIDNGCNIWNEDAYNYYSKTIKNTPHEKSKVSFEEFINLIKINPIEKLRWNDSYTLGDCGKQYGWLWRDWVGYDTIDKGTHTVDQIKELINGLKSNPMGRRHIVTAWNPSTLDDMALNACHAFVQFNCRPIKDTLFFIDRDDIQRPKYYLDCQMYQRSADVFLGVPYNIASYALLTHILAKICNMEIGDLIHTFGDVHIYDNHMEAVDEILTRTSTELPTLNMMVNTKYQMEYELGGIDFDKFINSFDVSNFQLENYNPQSLIKAKLSTGLK